MERQGARAGIVKDGISVMPSQAPVRRNGRQIGGSTEVKRAAFFGPKDWIARVYGKGRRRKIGKLATLHPEVIDLANFEEHAASLREVQVIFSTWGFPSLTAAQLDRLESLEAIFYAGGTVQGFAQQYLERGITVVSAWRANAVPVAEFTLAQILLSAKGYFRHVREYKSPKIRRKAFKGRGIFGETIAILGAGAIGSRVIELLNPCNLRIIVFDPFLRPERAAALGVESVSLEAAFERAYVISNHLANLPETKGLLRGELFDRMRRDATFINTGRGETVDQESMIEVLRKRRDLTALLDVTFPEPAPDDSPLFEMPNVILSGHIAGSMNDELVRMADYCIEEYVAFLNNRPLRFAVSKAMLETMA
jgi:phosphoglycerate dehydrogenase-like enzyme